MLIRSINQFYAFELDRNLFSVNSAMLATNNRVQVVKGALQELLVLCGRYIEVTVKMCTSD